MPMKKRATSAIVGTLAGALIAIVMIACAAAPSRVQKTAAPAAMQPDHVQGAQTPEAPPGGGTTPRGQIAALDQAITQDMQKLQLQRPPAPANACIESCAQQMATAVEATAATPADCKPGASEKCGETCKLKDSICTAAGNICRIANELGGTDSVANDACNRGNASCDAAKQRCCSCL
jgi:hypothetical protein